MSRKKKDKSMGKEEDTKVKVEIDETEMHVADEPEQTDTGVDEAKEPQPNPQVKEEKAPEENESERYMRLAAEFENYKKRTAREFGGIMERANARLLRDLIEIIDNFERALNVEDNSGNNEAYRKGIELIYQQLNELIQKEKVEPIKAVGQVFDPNLHEAMMQQPSDEYDEGVVIQEFQKGYRLGEKVLRHSRVIVSTGPAGDYNENENDK